MYFCPILWFLIHQKSIKNNVAYPFWNNEFEVIPGETGSEGSFFHTCSPYLATYFHSSISFHFETTPVPLLSLSTGVRCCSKKFNPIRWDVKKKFCVKSVWNKKKYHKPCDVKYCSIETKSLDTRWGKEKNEILPNHLP